MLFFQVFSKNSLIKNIFEEEKRLIVEHDFFWKIVLYWFIWAVPRQGRQANHGTVQKSTIYLLSQAIKNGLNEAMLLI